ncbi:MAG: response regulator, partial [Acidobacteria bacterium]|nr:response regulator [Acidobacteriota bacterium]
MEKELRILILEDIAEHAELVERELRQAGIVFTSRRVMAREAFIAALEDFKPSLILADYSLPSFDGMSALATTRELCPDVPFVFVSGAMGEEVAIESLKQGATDYVLKQRLSRLVPAVRRALRESEERAALKQAELALLKAHSELALKCKEREALLEINNAIIANLDRQSLFKAIAHSLRQSLPFDRALLFLYRPEQDALRVTALEGLPPAFQFGRIGSEVKREGSHVGWVLDNKRYLLRRNLAEELQF